jgi:hypothetical protein
MILAGEGGKGLYPKTAQMVKRVREVMGSGPVTLSKLDKLRSQVGEIVIKGGEPIIGYRLRDKIDEFIDTTMPAPGAGGGAAEAAAAIRTARDLNARFKKAEAVTNAVESADLRASSTYAGGNQENAIRQNIRPLIDPKSGQRIRNFTPAEKKAANRVVRGSPTQNAARVTGKMLDPRGILGASVQTMMGLKSGGLSTASIPLGMVATEIGKRATGGNVKALLKLISAGGKPPVPPAPVAPGSVRLLTPTGIAGAGVLDAAAGRALSPAEAAVIRARAKTEEDRKRRR